MSSHEKTLKIVMNLDRAGIESRLAQVRSAAQRSAPELAKALAGVDGLPRADMEARVKSAMKLVAGRPEHKSLMAQLELVELNLPNLK